MIEVINRAVQFITELVLVPSIVADLRQEIHTSWVYDDFKVLNKLNTVVDTILALISSLDPESIALQLINRLWFCRICCDPLFRISHISNILIYSLIGKTCTIHFIPHEYLFVLNINESTKQC